jgi:sorbitol-specific phosphotransferase system component IIBC
MVDSMINVFQHGPGPLPKTFYLPAIVCIALFVGAQFLPDGSLFGTLRGMTVGFGIMVLIATIVGATTMHRREAWRKQTSTLDDLEPFGEQSFDPIERDRP